MRVILFSLLCMAFSQYAAAAEPASHNPQPFSEWLEAAKAEAKEMGISDETIATAMNDIEPDARIIELDRKQPESTLNFKQYLQRVIYPDRIAKGIALRKEYATVLERVAEEHGVQPQYIVALWGIETNYGQSSGTYNVIEALATLAYDGRRSEFFRKEMFNALRIIDAGDITADEMMGSWAGAMGQCQFMPSSFKNFAVDADGDGRRDIWDDADDVLASIANYLSQSGWNDNEKWGVEVKLPKDFDKSLADIENVKPVSEWRKLGITQADGSALPDNPDEGTLIFVEPEEFIHPYLIYNNYKTILKWNRSRYFATAVGLLANHIEQGE